MEFTQWLTLLGICLLGAMSPGPSLAVVVSATLHGGRPHGIAAAIAHGCGVALYGLLTVTSLALLITESAQTYMALQLTGAAYLAYLGARSLRSGATDPEATEASRSFQNPWIAGFAVAFLNPKLAVFMLALFSQFLQPGYGLAEKGVMVATVGITDALWYAFIASVVAQKQLLTKLRERAAIIDKIFGVVLLLLAASVTANALGLLA